MRIRGYREGDVDAMTRLDDLCFDEFFRFDRPTMKEFAEARGAIVLLAEDDAAEDLAGFVILHLEGQKASRRGYLVTIDVAPAAHGRGIGTELLRHAEDAAHAAGALRVDLHVAVGNAAAIRFYEGMKYQRAGRARKFYSRAGLDALVYTKTLLR